MKTEKLSELFSKATPGPWAARKEEYDSHDAMTVATGKSYARGGHVLHYLTIGGVFPAFTGNGPTSKANAEYLAAAHDAMPALLKLVKAVDEYIEINQTHLDPEEKFLAMCEAFDELTP